MYDAELAPRLIAGLNAITLPVFAHALAAAL